MRKRRSAQRSDERPTRRDLFFFHLSELEQVIERGGIEWDEQLRLAQLFTAVMNAAAGTKGQRQN
jgi:hypothetical protein